MERTRTAPAPASLLAFLATVPDPRAARGRRHPLSAMSAAACGAILRGARGSEPIAQWLRDQDLALAHAPGFTREPPRRGAFRKLLVASDPVSLEPASAGWAEATSAGSPPAAHDRLEPAAPDGLAVRGGIGRREGAVHLLSAMAQRRGSTSRQADVGTRADGHEAASGPLKGPALEGRVVTGDAMPCQRDPGAPVVADGGHDFVVVQDNRPELPRDIEGASTRAADAAFPPRQRERTARQSTERRATGRHGDRIESRRSRATDLLDGYLDRPSVGRVGQVERAVKRRGGEVSREVACAITGAPKEGAGAAASLGRRRGHRGLEDRSHYVRDVTMGEGGGRIRTGSGPQGPAAFRGAAIGWLRPRGADDIAAALRRNAAQVPRLLMDLGILKQRSALRVRVFQRSGRNPCRTI